MRRDPGRTADRVDRARAGLAARLGSTANGGFVVTAPLRVCPLGAHVDHQGGTVTGFTVDRGIAIAAAPSADAEVRVESLDFGSAAAFGLGKPLPPARGDWSDYVRGAVAALTPGRGLERGLRGVVAGDLPGAGLSSSAALLIAILGALARVNGLELSRRRLCALVQKAENEHVGVASGPMDPAIILHARHRHLTRLDCSTFSLDDVGWPSQEGPPPVLVAFSGISRALASSGFNTRVAECRAAARRLLELAGRPVAVDAVLSRVAPEIFEVFGTALPPPERRRAAHYFAEQRRVRDGFAAWERGEAETFGALMTESGDSSIANYESGTPELVTLYELLAAAPGVLGARFSGGGFGGSCVALVDRGAVNEVVGRVGRSYAAAHPRAAAACSFHLCEGADAAALTEPDR